jgi:hypothetical protein
MPVASEPFAAVYEERNRLGVISLPGTVSDPTRGRCRDHHDAPLGRANHGEYSAEMSQPAHLQSGGAGVLG